MLDKLINKNLDFLKNTINCDDDSLEIYRYALRIVYSYVIDVIALMALAIVTHTVIETVIVLLLFALLQVYGGGFHAETQIKCFMLTLLGWFIGLFGIKRLILIHPSFGIISMIVFSIVVIINTPILNEKHPVTGAVYKRSKRIVRVTLVVLDIVLAVSVIAKIDLLYCTIGITQVLSTASILSAIIKNRLKDKTKVIKNCNQTFTGDFT